MRYIRWFLIYVNLCPVGLYVSRNCKLIKQLGNYWESCYADSWQLAIVEEYQSIQEPGTWTVHKTSDIPAGRQPVGSKWVFKVKFNADGWVERYKARIVAKGYSQIEGLDYDETFAAVTRYDALRLIIALATHLGLDTDQLDIKLAFLNGDLVEEIWMVPPPGIGLDGKILRLDKALYGFKQPPLAWF